MKRQSQRIRKILVPVDFSSYSESTIAYASMIAKSRVSMIVIGSHGRIGLKRFVFGSVAEKTLRYAPCPVLVFKK